VLRKAHDDLIPINYPRNKNLDAKGGFIQNQPRFQDRFKVGENC